jgi:hypothetical protein
MHLYSTLEEFGSCTICHDSMEFLVHVGVHPRKCPGTSNELSDWRCFQAVGHSETGLDYYRLGDRTLASMERVLQGVYQAACQNGKPRRAYPALLEDTAILTERRSAASSRQWHKVRGVFTVLIENQRGGPLH